MILINKQKQSNSNGSFLCDSNKPSTPTKNKLNDDEMTNKITIVPQLVDNELNKTLETDVVLLEIDKSSYSAADKCCSDCGLRLKLLEAKKQRENELMSEFNLNTADYSPNQKCVNYIQANSFTSTNGNSIAPSTVLIN